MPRLLSLLPALVVAAVTLAPPAGAGTGDDRPPLTTRSQARPAVPADDGAPLRVTIDALSPSYVPARGSIRINGSVTNTSEDTWSNVNTYAFAGSTPITSVDQLADEVALDPLQPVGDRITVPGTFDDVDDLDPGESAQYAIRLPVAQLPVDAAGVYWFGVHALGEGPEGRDVSADGRARTFLPLVPRSDEKVEAALVVPVRHPVRHEPDGSIAEVERWARHLESGPLRTLVDFGASAGSRPLTWLVDPAVPEAVRDLVSGNPPRSLEDTLPPDDGQDDEGEDDEEPTGPADPTDSDEPEPSGSGEPQPSEAPGPDPEDAPPTAATEPGTAWLNRLREAMRGDQVLALPYGDLDVSAASRRDPDVYQQARRRSGRELAPWGRRTAPAVSSPSGYLDPSAIDLLHGASTVLVTDRMLPIDAPVVRSAGHRLLATSFATSTGGPGPDERLAATALRQRILAEAALRLMEGGDDPLVVVLPADWAPDTTTGFFEGLDVRWLDLRKVSRLSTPRPVQVDPDDLSYPGAQVHLELDAANFTSAQALVEAGETLQNVLLRNDRIADDVVDQALTSLSYASRTRADAARAETDRSRAWIADQLAAVSVRAPRAVTLSSSSGRFAATISNDLAHPVTVKVQAVSDRPLEIVGPDEIEVAANSRTSVLLQARTDRLGVHNVQLLVTDVDGVPLGSTDSLPIRSAQVSEIIWVILGAGVALLFGAIAVRLVRRLLGARA